MKKILFITMLLAFGLSAYGQKEKIEKQYKAGHVAFLTNYLDLSPEEAEKFWPLYNEYKGKEKELRSALKAEKHKSDDMSEAEASAYLDKMYDTEAQLVDLRKSYYGKMKNAMPATKVAKIGEAERAFRKSMVNHIRNKKKGKR